MTMSYYASTQCCTPFLPCVCRAPRAPYPVPRALVVREVALYGFMSSRCGHIFSQTLYRSSLFTAFYSIYSTRAQGKAKAELKPYGIPTAVYSLRLY